MKYLFSEKQLEALKYSTARWNIFHGSVSSGKTMIATVRFMHAVDSCPDSQIWMIGHTSSTIYDNVVRLILEPKHPDEPDPLTLFRPFCNWKKGDRELLYKDKVISTVGAKDSGAIGAIQGKTMSLVYCDEMTLYPENIIDMIDTRLRNPHSMGFATMNPSYPTHKIKGWIDRAIAGDPNYYQLHFMLDDNPYLDQRYKDRIKNSLSGVFYKRNYLGEWCLAEGSIFDFFERSAYVLKRPPRAADYWIVGVDYGTSNAFAAVLIGVNCGIQMQDKPMMWAEKEYYWDSNVTKRQKTSSEFAQDIKKFIDPYAVRAVYIDPSAAHFKLDLQRLGIHPVNADNDVNNGIIKVTSDMKAGKLFICEECTNLIREIEGYVWHPKCKEKGEDQPLKLNDHAIDAFRYAIHTHKPVTYNPEAEKAKRDADIRKNMSGWNHPNHYGFR